MAPPQGWVKANCDAAIEKKSGWVGLGVVKRDHQGNMVAAKSFTRKGLLELVAVEALAAIMAIQLSCELGFQRLYLKGDAKIVVDVVLSTKPDWSRKGHLVEDIQVELQSLQCWKMVYVRLEANQTAHKLARMASRQMEDRLWTSGPPKCIAETIVAEQSALFYFFDKFQLNAI